MNAEQSSSAFGRLHPSLQHHIVNSLGWRSLRPLQEATIDPILAGDHALLLAPTAGGKTEAASFPVISRIAEQDWQPLSVLYLAPLRALLNNLLPRLERYASFTGHRVALWHGDVGPGDRSRILGEPPDILLTTPESLEAMLMSTRAETSFFRNVQTVVVDEVHAFASDDRGWHMLAVLERLSRITGRELQRLGLSATVGNPEELLEWLTPGTKRGSHVIAPPASAIADETDVQIDWVGSLGNAARVIAALHRGEKRLVFVDSRAGAEHLTSELLTHDVNTFVSHGSLGREERRRTEQAFSESQNCVIVATSTLELGIDIGDLDRVIQIDAPPTVASFLQRLGRTGRRSGSVRNALFLGVSKDAFLQSLALARLYTAGFVEPVRAPAFPAHLLAQQMMALTLQEDGLGASEWRRWLGEPHAFGAEVFGEGDDVLQHMLDEEILFNDEGLLSFGQEGEATFGRYHFMELMSAFTSEPVFAVRAGRNEIGHVPDVALAAADQNGGRLLLAGRHWFIDAVDWKRRVINVLPATGGGKIKFWGSAQPLSFELCQSIRAVLNGADVGVPLSKRAQEKLVELQADFPWLAGSESMTHLAHSDTGATRWFTFAGLKANLELAARMSSLRGEAGAVDNLSIAVDSGVTNADIRGACSQLSAEAQAFVPNDAMIDGLKFNQALRPETARRVAQRRLADSPAVSSVLGLPGSGANG